MTEEAEILAEEEKEVFPKVCPFCKKVIGWAEVEPVDPEDSCESCKALPTDPKVPKDLLIQHRMLRDAGLLGSELLPCEECGASPCSCKFCPECDYVFYSDINTCENCEHVGLMGRDDYDTHCQERDSARRAQREQDRLQRDRERVALLARRRRHERLLNGDQ